MRVRDPQERIILALDVADFEKAKGLVADLKEYVGIFKVGIKLFTNSGPRAVKMIQEFGRKVFLDLKIHDIPHIASNAGEEATKLGVFMYNLHALGGFEMMKEVVNSTNHLVEASRLSKPIILAVTILTSLDSKDIEEIGINYSLEEEAIRLARLSQRAGVDGVIASPKEARKIKEELGQDFIIVSPGIRSSLETKGDQKRSLTPKEALKSGVDYLVLGRPILDSKDPKSALLRVIEEIS